jgi:capsular polysaccharide biosynthesis protein
VLERRLVRRFLRQLRFLARGVALGRWYAHRATGGRWSRHLPTAIAERSESVLEGDAYLEVAPPEVLRRRVPTGEPPDHWRFADLRTWTTTAGFVARLPGGRVLGMPPAVITGDGTLLGDLSATSGTTRTSREHPVFRRLRVPGALHCDGEVVALASRSSHNYFPFVVETLPRLWLLERAGIGPDAGTRYWVPAAPGYQADYLALLGIATDDTIDPARHPHVSADMLIVPSLPDYYAQTPAWVVDYLRGRLLPVAAGPGPGPGDTPRPDRIYLRRPPTPWSRRVTNDDDVLEVLQSRGIEPVSVEHMAVEEQIRLFAGASLIVAPHGAALTNVVYAPPSVSVVELFAPSYVNCSFWALADLIGCRRYFYCLGEGDRPAPGRDLSNVRADITVDLTRLKRVLDLAEAGLAC